MRLQQTSEAVAAKIRISQAVVTCWVLGTMVNQMKNQTVDIEILIYQNTQCISI